MLRTRAVGAGRITSFLIRKIRVQRGEYVLVLLDHHCLERGAAGERGGRGGGQVDVEFEQVDRLDIRLVRKCVIHRRDNAVIRVFGPTQRDIITNGSLSRGAAAYPGNINRIAAEIKIGNFCQAQTVHEHPVRGVKQITERSINRCQAGLPPEHVIRIGYTSEFNTGKIHGFQYFMCAGSPIKHAGQMVDWASARNVNCCQIIAALEHIRHVITVIQVFQPGDRFQIIAISEHFFHCADIRQIPVSQIYILHIDDVFEHKTHVGDSRCVNFSVRDS